MDRIKQTAARRQGLPVEQIKYWRELTETQRTAATKPWGKIPPYKNYVYCVGPGPDGEMGSIRFGIVELEWRGLL